MKSLTPVRAASNSTVAVLVARFTLARSTPGVSDKVRSIARAQAAHVMPLTGRSTRSAAAAFMRALDSRVAGRLRPRPRALLFRRHILPWQPNPPDRPPPSLLPLFQPVFVPRCARSCHRSYLGQSGATFRGPYLYDGPVRSADSLN